MTTFAELIEAQGSQKRRTYPEDALQIACKYWWDTVFCVELRRRLGLRSDMTDTLRLLLHHSPNEGKLLGHDRDGAKRKAMGVRAGFPDFILLMGNREHSFMAVELKSEKGRQSASQKAYEQAVRLSGGQYMIVRTRDQFEQAVRGYMDSVRLDTETLKAYGTTSEERV